MDEYGNLTGSPVPEIRRIADRFFLTVSPNKGDASIEPFGTLTDYDRTMSTADTTCPISGTLCCGSTVKAQMNRTIMW